MFYITVFLMKSRSDRDHIRLMRVDLDLYTFLDDLIVHF